MPRPKKNVALRRKYAEIATKASVDAAKRRRSESEPVAGTSPAAAAPAVCDMNGGAGPYGKDCKVVKAECVNHVAKRLGTGLRALKKTRGGAQKGKAATMGGRHKLKAVYERLTSDELMTRCLQGMTQNRNEHLHSRIWRICPKHRNASKMIVDFACATAVCNYNVGYSASSLTGILGIESTLSMEKYLQTQDVAMDSPYRRKMRNNKMRRDLEYAAGKF